MRFFRIYFKVLGGHTHTRWYSGGNPNAVMGKCGDLTFVNDEWEALAQLLHTHYSAIQLIDEGGMI